MYFIQAAMEGWQEMQRSGSFYGSTVDKASAAAAEYKKGMSPHLEWMKEEDVILEPGARMNAHETWRSYKEWIKEGVTGNTLHRETKAEFRENLIAATGRQISYGRYADEWVFFGARFSRRQMGTVNPVNVIQFPTAEEAKKGG
jgi:hypothetical protein